MLYSTTEHLQIVVIRIVTRILRQPQTRDTFIPIRQLVRITLGTLDEDPTFVQETAAGGDGSGKTTYKFTFPALTSVDHLLVAGGGGGGGGMGGGGGAGGYLETTGTTISAGQKTIVVGGGGVGGHEYGSYENRGRNGADTSVTGLTTAIGGGGGASGYDQTNLPAGNGGSGGGGSGGRGQTSGNGGERGTGTAGQGFDGAQSGNHWYPGGGGGASQQGMGVTVHIVYRNRSRR